VIALEVIAGPDAGARHVLPDAEPQLIGRSTEAIGSTDPTMSRRHAELTPSTDGWFVRDLQSTHGTHVNGDRIAGRRALRPGDVVRCGGTEFRVAEADAAVPAAREGSDPARLQAIGETVATISHGIKNILQGLRSGADAVELAIRREDLAMAREGWPIVARNLDRVSWLVMNMLAYAKDRPLEIEETQLEAVVGEVVELMQSTAARRRVRLELHLDSPLPPAPIDANAVHQAVLNLVANAVEAAPDRTGTVAVRCTLEAKDGRFAVEVDDDGPGVPREQRPRLFEPFASTKGQRGTGLGLAVARKLVERHGGRIVHADRSPRGTRMRIELPADRGDPDAERTRGPVAGRTPDIRWDAGPRP
jgi:signal transduction histidine kinase